MAKKITVKGLVVIMGNMNGSGSMIQLAAEIKPIKGAQPGAMNATAKTVVTINHEDPEWFKQFSLDQKVDVDINIS